jgi:hypothetical protein
MRSERVLNGQHDSGTKAFQPRKAQTYTEGENKWPIEFVRTTGREIQDLNRR